MSNLGSVVGSSYRDVRSRLGTLVLTDIAYKVIAVVVLTPLVGLLLRLLVATSGNAVLTDQDILLFLVRPLGWICAIAVGALWIAIVAVEQAALLRVLVPADGQQVGLIDALRFAAAHFRAVVHVTARMVAVAIVAVAPFLVVAAAVYLALLTEFDINYYMRETPPEWWIALSIGGVIVVALVAVLLRLVTSWLFALPLVLFEDVRPGRALRTSGVRAIGHRWTLALWVAAWAVASMLLSSLATAAVVGIGRLVVPGATSSLALLEIVVGAIVILWAVVNLAVNLASTIAFAAMLLTLYHRLGGGEQLESVPLGDAAAQRSTPHVRLTYARLALVGAAAVVVALAVGGYAAHTIRLDDDVQIMAHRGSSLAAPENTLAAVHQAMVDGAEWVEIDVQETADGEVVVYHDSDFMRLAGERLNIWDATLADLQDIDIGSWFGPEFGDQRVPTLAEVLDECRGHMGVNIELKYYGHDDRLEERVAETVTAHGMENHVVAMSLNGEMVKRMKALRPDWQVGLLMSVAAGRPQSIDADFLAINAKFATRRMVRATHAAGKQVYVWTVDDAPTMSAMIGRGVDCLITNNPALARRVIAERAEMSVPERLLIELAALLGTTPNTKEQ